MDIKGIKNGAVRMARAANVPLIPMIVFGGQRVISYDHRDLSRGTPIAITVGEPMPLTRGANPDALTDELTERLRALLDETVARYPDTPPGAWWVPARLGGGAPTLAEAEEIELKIRQARRSGNAG
jgi:1-acyl-sn-glycerol-3-phosphate acyltransferase